MGASRAFAKSRNQEILKRRGSAFPGGGGGSIRSRSSNSDSKGTILSSFMAYILNVIKILQVYVINNV